MKWVEVCAANKIEEEDVIRFDYGEQTFAVYRIKEGYFASDGRCTHENQHLAEGLVVVDTIECPLHQGRFHIPTGRPLNPPVCINLRTYPVKVENDVVFIQVES